MRILAVIPARGGSKRLPGKNVRILGDKPLIMWSIDVIKEISEICNVLVSTDDPNTFDIARSTDALVPWLRPPELATDTASAVEVCLHALDWYELEQGSIDGLLLLQPTSPFRTQAKIKEGIELFCSYHYRPVIGVSPAKSHPMWCFKLKTDTMIPFMIGGLESRSQDLPPAYVINGSFYLISPPDLRQHRTFYTDNTVPLVIDSPKECIDIDTEWDWNIAEMVAQNEQEQNSSHANN